MARDFGGKVVVITGASSGIGRGTALAFAAAGASVVVSARRGDVLDTLAAECVGAGGQARAVTADVSVRADVEALAAAAVAAFGRIDLWVNNAGSGALGKFEDVPLADHVHVIETDLLGTLYGSYFALKQFKTQNAGTLINIASVIGKVPAPYFASYAAAKHGVVGLSGAIRQELTEADAEQIHVCTVLPASMDTPFFVHTANYTGHEAVPIPPVYDPQAVVDAILALAEKPQDEVSVGAAASATVLSHNLARAVTEAAMGRLTGTALKQSDPAPDTQSGLYSPVPEGTTVTGGYRETQ